jgi:uncharacterized cupredoxin-like copper-binding protein
MQRVLALIMLAAATLVLLAGCTRAGAAATTVAVVLRDGGIEASPTDVPAGSVRFDIRNAGSAVHELEVFRVPADVDANQLPVTNHVAQTGTLESVDEVEEIAPSTGAVLTVGLSAGTYALICNLPGHYEAGMHTTLSVR